ncbi:MAG: hypothetical protein DRJ42_16160 [Deltaproteobacteria bacterium]|nr:MAG: hypothetical protein DRJ42_16160 [Deltaproteobacteria bacterium]
MAREAYVAVILRRGPSGWYQLIEWNTRRDMFSDGAWFKGRIYEEKCDLSPDGQLFLCFCFQGSRLSTDYTDSWTAVSRSPYLYALALWPSGTTYGGGGRFVSNRGVMLRTRLAPVAHRQHPGRGLEVTTGGPAVHRSSAEVDDADWCGRDQGGCLVFTRAGKLYRRRGEEDLLLGDFDERTPDPAPAPKWAKMPLR